MEENCLVSWCLGHLAEYARPEEYDERYAKWQFTMTCRSFLKVEIQVSADKSSFSKGSDEPGRYRVSGKYQMADAGQEGELIFQSI